jgi:hypothetical protein
MRTSENAKQANFLEIRHYEVRRNRDRRSSGFPPEKSIIVMPVTLKRASPEEVW